ncbi:MAG TPA: hypothetical protein VI874_01335, partial [Candidatus Norongarragalinales archaeon]|nr:hypothetical protein [Candidatus Norongarragalinales archaeon]
LVYPGPLSFADFRDLEENARQDHGFFIVDLDAKSTEFIPIKVASIHLTRADADNQTASDANAMIQNVCKNAQKSDVALLHVKGTLSGGKPSDIDWKAARTSLSENSPIVYVNNALQTKERPEVRVAAESPEKIAESVFRENLADAHWPDALKSEKGVSASMELLARLRQENPGDNKKRWEDVVSAKTQQVLGIEA